MKTNIPKLRFIEFKEDPVWEEKKLGEVADYVDYRGKTPKKVDDGIFLVTAKNIKKGYIDYKTSREYIAIDDYNYVMSRGLPQIGDVLITTEAPCGNVAQIDDDRIALAQRVIKYRGKNKVLNNNYLMQYLLGKTFQKMLDNYSTGGTVKGVKGSVLHKMHIVHPVYKEQEKIGKFLSTLDRRIELQEKLIEKLEEEKKGYLQKLFPKKGKNIPELRFEEFNDAGEWDNITLDTVMSVPVHSRVENPTIDKIVRVRMHLNGLTRVPDNSTLNLSATNYYYRKLGQFIYGKQNVFNGCFDIVTKDYDGSYSSGDVTSLDFKDNFDSIFTYYYFSRKTFYNSLERFAKGSGSKRLHESDLLKISVTYPDIYEQKKIGITLRSISKKISKYQFLLEYLKSQKDYILSNVLV